MKSFAHKRPVRNEAGEVINSKLAPVWRRTEKDCLGDHHGTDKGRGMVVGLLYGDLIAVRPAGTRREPRVIKPSDLYDYLIRCEANKEAMQRLREKKERKAQRLADARQKRAEDRLRRPL